ncbi:MULTISPECIES: TrkH family potassium uptake protein [Acinetobacter]|jgi:trk system potassium uptake protein TrkH|uniref:TrkH family potassium uptake protein n=1 Tax=Acinetobacter TaxID=469 RepID=UPI000263E11B|nr:MULTISPECIES: TrkH family potassium uptake protein [Acinetobacter]EIM39112.1 potassium uptake protein (TrkH) [Acinetobacter sp. HA]MCO8066173.1 TrkH family potassium uptake protein [Acinetobacter schindleri]MDP1444598.1 TrkH family potassium uptake protein [Acinetobacter schindleri]UOH76149.1 TrkH family potassium uptake protein [Acinetobacter schindleri]WDE14850.1 TrkH family potassium uptake protein [Acinetobacter schindleri]
MKITAHKNRTINLSPPSIIALGFLALILIGSILLILPVSHHGDVTWFQAVFTATSAVTITGLSVVNVGEAYTVFGKIVIMILLQCGGLGFMTFAILAAMSLAPKMGLRQQVMAQESIGQTSLKKISTTIKGVFLYSLFFEAIGTVILTIAWLQDYNFAQAFFYASFYSISAFNNGGFSLFPNSLMSFADQYLITFTISMLYIIGGIGFLVLMDVRQHKRWRKLSTNSKLILSTIAALNLSAFILIWILEASNPQTLALMSVGDQAVNAWFHATVPRSSGFNSLPMDQLTNASTLVTMFLMFIGGGSLSTAGGIKVGTFIIVVISVISFLRREDEIRLFKHSIPEKTTFKALAVVCITALLIATGFMSLLILEPDQDFLDLLFETVSAACTVGLSRGVTSELQPASLLILMLLMFAGRLGPLTLAYFIATPKKSRLKHPPSEIQVG